MLLDRILAMEKITRTPRVHLVCYKFASQASSMDGECCLVCSCVGI